MSYLSGKKFKTPLDPLLQQLRKELYVEPYESIQWTKHRSNICPVDLYSPHPLVLEGLFMVTNTYERVAPRWLRQRGLDYTYKLITMEDENTEYQCQAPVNKAINMMCVNALLHVSRLPLTIVQLSLGARRTREPSISRSSGQARRLHVDVGSWAHGYGHKRCVLATDLASRC